MNYTLNKTGEEIEEILDSVVRVIDLADYGVGMTVPTMAAIFVYNVDGVRYLMRNGTYFKNDELSLVFYLPYADAQMYFVISQEGVVTHIYEEPDVPLAIRNAVGLYYPVTTANNGLMTPTILSQVTSAYSKANANSTAISSLQSEQRVEAITMTNDAVTIRYKQGTTANIPTATNASVGLMSAEDKKHLARSTYAIDIFSNDSDGIEFYYTDNTDEDHYFKIPVVDKEGGNVGLMSVEDKERLDGMDVTLSTEQKCGGVSVKMVQNGKAQVKDIPLCSPTLSGVMSPQDKEYLDKMRKTYIFKTFQGTDCVDQTNAFLDSLVADAHGITMDTDYGQVTGATTFRLLLTLQGVSLDVFVTPQSYTGKIWVQIAYNGILNEGGKISPNLKGVRYKRTSYIDNDVVKWTAWKEE